MTLAALTLCVACEKPPQEPEKVEEFSIDGKQWSFTRAAMSMSGYTPYFGGNYTITPTDATSGKISVIDPNDPTQTESVLTYTDLTATSVKVTIAALGLDACEMKLVENKIEIQM